jgi:peptidoglycan/xylan/chitin deacetylase (PgdA/CDA1 family)
MLQKPQLQHVRATLILLASRAPWKSTPPMGLAFGFAQFKAYDFLGEGEVVLTFDDGPWPGNTPAVLKALAAQCTKALFFAIGKHAIWHPEILKQVAAAGHTIGSHTWQRFCVEHHGQLV